jgi:Flp pilus assembly protein TadD
MPTASPGESHSIALLRRAAELRERDALEEARRCCEEALRASPEDPAALGLLAALAADARQLDAAQGWAARASVADPRASLPHYSLGRAYQAEGRLAEAEASYRESIARAPAHPGSHNNLGCVLQMQGRLGEAISSFRQALALDPSLPQANQNLATITRDRAALEAAAAGYRARAAQNPADALLWCDLGNVCRELGRHDEALASFADAVRRQPDLAEAHFSLGQVQLLLGDYANGWDEYEWRWRVKGLGTRMPEYRQPLWQGEPLPGGTLLLYAEQGIGDTLQFARYATLAAARCARVILQVPRPLTSTLAALPGVSQAIAHGDAPPAFDAHLPLMSLARVFRTTPQTVPWTGPYVSAEPTRVEAWRKRLTPGARLHVGLVWAGRPDYWDDRKRSTDLATLAPLAAPDIAFYSLQWGEAAAQAATSPRGMRLADFGEELRPFGETLALLACLDVVITVDTAMSHLAGAAGLRTWLLLARAPDWRWLLEREDSPWYPGHRLFRQDRDGDWSGPVERVARELRYSDLRTSMPFR